MTPILPWYIAGPLIGLMVPLLLILREKQLGISSSFRWWGSLLGSKLPYFQYTRKADLWQVEFAVGLILAGFCFVGLDVLPEGRTFDHIAYSQEYLPVIGTGGLLIGFGARMAGGCTAGHCIMGNAQFSLASLVSTVSFFIGGWAASNFLVPYLFQLP